MLKIYIDFDGYVLELHSSCKDKKLFLRLIFEEHFDMSSVWSRNIFATSTHPKSFHALFTMRSGQFCRIILSLQMYY